MGGWWYLGSSVYAFIGGGTVVFITGAFSYIADISGRESRTARVAFVDFGIYAGLPTGIITGGYLFQVVGYVGIFAMAAAIRVLCLVYVVRGGGWKGITKAAIKHLTSVNFLKNRSCVNWQSTFSYT